MAVSYTHLDVYKRQIPERLQKTLMSAMGVSVLFVGVSGTLSQMLRAEGPRFDERMLRGQKAEDRIDLRDLQLLLPRHIRQDRRQALGEHALAGARRAHQKDILSLIHI